uniref:Mediator of RNA polymerase II transcription subunit 6 n=1 Tax=Oryza nivara TaxID=4536 RepID=A0A0E0HMQ3_ORYNI
MLAYYILDGSIYQAPQLCSVFASRIGYASHLKSFYYGMFKVGENWAWYVETEPDTAASESKTQKEAIDLKELKRVDHILMSLQRKLQPAPPPPPFPEGYVPSEQEKASDDLLASEALPPQIEHAPWNTPSPAALRRSVVCYRAAFC